jgi:Icc-related predicted phosphoesterase
MLIRAYSDLHGYLPVIEPCDALLIAGDICPSSGQYGDHTPKTQARWLKEVFNPWCEAMPVEQIVLVAGNHDVILSPIEGRGYTWNLGEKVSYLLDTSVRLNGGPTIFGSPWIPDLPGWPFHKSADDLRKLASDLPEGQDIWLLHAPPACTDPGYRLDVARRQQKRIGNRFITPIIRERGPQLVICGHVHEGYGQATIGETQIANVAFLDERYVVRWRHLDIEWDPVSRKMMSAQLAIDDPARGLWWRSG